MSYSQSDHISIPTTKDSMFAYGQFNKDFKEFYRCTLILVQFYKIHTKIPYYP